jgi:integrase
MAESTVEVNGRTYHLFARPNKKARNKVWWAWYWDYEWQEVDGEDQLVRVRRRESTGKRLKAEAKNYLKQLGGGSGDSLQEYVATRGFFIRGQCPYIEYKDQKDGVADHTVAEHYNNLHTWILPQLGSVRMSELTGIAIERALHSATRTRKDGTKEALSKSKRDGLWNTLKIVLHEAHREGLITAIPTVRRLRGKTGSTRRDILTKAETRALFPDTTEELERIWTAKSIHANGAIHTGKEAQDPFGLMFGIAFRTMLHAGLRSGEVRALGRSWLFPKYNGILVQRQINSAGELAPLKKGSDEDGRHRFVKVPRATMRLLQWWAEHVEGDFLFTIGGKPVSKDYLVDRFRVGLENAEIQPGKRKLSPYSLRYTYRSRMEGLLDPETIQESMGHRGEEISDHYLHLTEEAFRNYDAQQTEIEKAWN